MSHCAFSGVNAASGKSVVRWSCAIAVGLALLGCGDNSKYLPKPRPPADDEEEVAPKPATPSPGTAPGTSPSEKPTGAPTPSPALANRPVTPPANAAAAPATTAPPAGATPATSPPPTVVQQKTSERERRERVIAQLRKISKALESLRERNSAYPATSFADGRFSWRVQLLPALGRTDLYTRFRLNEPWDSPHNKSLMNEIPDEFRSPEREDSLTCYQIVKGPDTAFGGPEPRPIDEYRDTPENTLLVVEVHRDLARPWTAPDDYEFKRETVQQDLFSMRQDCCFGIFGGISGVRRIAADLSDPQLLGLITPSGGEPFRATDTTDAAHPEVDQALIARLAEKPLPPRFAKKTGSPVPGTPSSTNVAASPAVAGVGTPNAPMPMPRPETADPKPVGTGVATSVERLESPTDEQLEAASTIVRDLYGEEYKRAKKPKDKRDFAKKLLDDVEKVQADAAGKFVLLRASRDIASKSGDISTALAACDRLARDFRVDALSMKLKALEQAATNLEGDSDLEPLYDSGLKLGDEALKLDDFTNAKLGYRLAMNSARRSKKPEREYRINLREDYLRESKLAYARLADHLHTLVRSPADPAANSAVGRYFALVKQDWDRGLPMLSRGDDQRLRELAQLDQESPAAAESQVAVADQWWDLAEKLPVAVEKANARSRAQTWYEKALPMLGASLHKLRVEKRIAEAKKLAGAQIGEANISRKSDE